MKSLQFLLAFVTVITTVTSKIELTGRDNKKLDCFYLVYNGSGAHNALSSYLVQSGQPFTCIGTTRLCWFKVCDTNDNGVVDILEFNTTFNTLNKINPSSNSLDDEVEVSGVLEKKA